MVRVRPFKALRPNEKYVDRVAELPYDTMNTEEAREMARNNENSYLRIDRAEIDLPPDTDIHSEKVYEKAAENLEDFIDRGIFIQDENPHLYIYREIMDGRSQVGIVGCVSVDESLDGKIKIHEHTKPDKVADRIKHIEYCKANTGTILLTYDTDKNIDKMIEEKMNSQALYDFKSVDGIRHTVWILDDKESKMMELAFEKVDSLYIADGHHRSAAAESYALKKRKENPNYNPEEEFNFYLAMIAPKDNLYVMDYNRVIKDINKLEVDEFINKVEKNFIVKESKEEIKPQEKYEYGMYLDGRWYNLKFKNIEKLDGTIEKLDVSVLNNYLIEPILDITVPQKDPRIDFIGGIRGVGEIKKRVDKDMKLGFSLYPTSIEELMQVADEKKIMPAKSTWFEPKVRCGLFLHRL